MTHETDFQFSTALIAGCGYLGQVVAKRWQEAGVQVSAMTRSEQRADDFRKRGWNPVVVDLSKPAAEVQLPQADVVLWAVGFDRSATASREAVWIDGLNWLLDSLQLPVSRFLYVSSTSVYGNVAQEIVTEETPADPVTEGGQCCRLAEQRVLDRFAGASKNDASATVLRLAGIYGPNRLLRRIDDLRNQTPLPGEPDHWLNLIHVDDAAAMIDWAAQQSQCPNVINVANSQTVLRRDYYGRLAELADTPEPVFGGASGTGRSRSANKRITSRYDFSGEAGFQFESVLDGLEDAFRRTG